MHSSFGQTTAAVHSAGRINVIGPETVLRKRPRCYDYWGCFWEGKWSETLIGIEAPRFVTTAVVLEIACMYLWVC